MVVLLGFLFALPVHAQSDRSACLDYKTFVERMHAPPRYDKVAEALKQGNLLTEVYADPKGNWIMVWVWPTGQTCIMDLGEGWRAVRPGGAI